MYTVSEIKIAFLPVFQKYKVKKAVLFGSYAKNSATDSSDIDIMVDTQLRGLKFFGFLDELCNTVTCPVECIDVQDIETDSLVDNEIKKTGVLLYECA